MKKPKITEGKWQWIVHDKSTITLAGSIDGIENHVLSCSPCKSCQERMDSADNIFGTCLVPNETDAKAISAVPELIDEGIKAIKHLHDYWYEGAVSDGQSHDAAEDFAQRKTEGLYNALKKAGVEL